MQAITGPVSECECRTCQWSIGRILRLTCEAPKLCRQVPMTYCIGRRIIAISPAFDWKSPVAWWFTRLNYPIFIGVTNHPRTGNTFRAAHMPPWSSVYIASHRRKFRSQMWTDEAAEVGRVREEKGRRKKIREENKSEERRVKCVKR